MNSDFVQTASVFQALSKAGFGEDRAEEIALKFIRDNRIKDRDIFSVLSKKLKLTYKRVVGISIALSILWIVMMVTNSPFDWIIERLMLLSLITMLIGTRMQKSEYQQQDIDRELARA